jgi:uncharacterized RDD family membrane protein YckC
MKTDPRPAEGKIQVDVVPAEARSLQGRRAGLVSRMIANIVDLGVVVAVVFGTYIVWAGMKLLWQGSSFTRPTPGFARAFTFATVVHIVYFAISRTGSGRTYGDQLMGLRVIGRTGPTLGLGMASIRAVICVLFPLGLLWAGIGRERRSVQDLIVRTSVIYDWQIHRSPSDDGSRDALGSGVDVQPAVADEPDDRHPEPPPRVDGE